MSDYFNDVIEKINKEYDGIAADNSKTGFSWSFNVSWDKIPMENRLVQAAIHSKTFQQYFDRWYSHWPEKGIDEKVKCFEAALISFVGHLFKYFIEQFSMGTIRAIDFTCDEDEKFDYLKCKFDKKE
jgi:hypothetical protein